VRHLRPWNVLLPGIGGSVAMTIVPPIPAPRYGGANRARLRVFF
jgi:hypothetical protein